MPLMHTVRSPRARVRYQNIRKTLQHYFLHSVASVRPLNCPGAESWSTFKLASAPLPEEKQHIWDGERIPIHACDYFLCSMHLNFFFFCLKLSYMAGFKSQFSKWLFALQVFKLSINPHRLVSRGWWLTRGPQTGWRMSRKRCLGAELGMLGDVRTYTPWRVFFFTDSSLVFLLFWWLKNHEAKALAIMYSTCLEKHKEQKHRRATTHLKYSVSDLQLFPEMLQGTFLGEQIQKHTLNWTQI